MSKEGGVDAVDRALTVLGCFGPTVHALSLADLARETGLYKSTILRLAVSLERFGYLRKGDDGRYRLGPSAWRLGVAYREGHPLAAIVQPQLEALSAETGETASYYIRNRHHRICLFRSTPREGILHAVVEGARLPLEQGAGGRVLLAWSEPLLDEHRELRDKGHAFSLGERDPDVAGLAVPVLSLDGRLLGAVGLSGPTGRFGNERVAELLPTLVGARNRLERGIAA